MNHSIILWFTSGRLLLQQTILLAAMSKDGGYPIFKQGNHLPPAEVVIQCYMYMYSALSTYGSSSGLTDMTQLWVESVMQRTLHVHVHVHIFP